MPRMISDELPSSDPDKRFDELFSGDDEEGEGRSGSLATSQLGIDFKDYPVEFLLQLRAEIDDMLPPMKLAEVDLEAELVLQFRTAKALQTVTLSDKYIEANKKSQVINAVASTLQHLVKMQSEFHTAERFKKIEALLVTTLRSLPEDTVATFFDRYERELGAMK